MRGAHYCFIGCINVVCEQGGDQITPGLIGLQDLSLGAQMVLAGQQDREFLALDLVIATKLSSGTWDGLLVGFRHC